MNSNEYDPSDAYNTFAYCNECQKRVSVKISIAQALPGKPMVGFDLKGHACTISDEQAQLERKRIAAGHR